MAGTEKWFGGGPGEGEGPQQFSRADFLKVLGAAGAAGVIGSNALLREAFAQENLVSSPRPTDLKFSIRKQYRPFDLLAENFVELRDGFDTIASAAAYAVLSPAPEDDAGNASFGGGSLRVSGDSYFALFRSNTGQRAPFATVILDVESFAGSGGAEDTVFAGLVKDEGNYVVAWYNDAKRLAGIDVATQGTVRTLGTVAADLAAPCRFAFALNENKAVALVDVGDGFRPLLRRDTRQYVDLRRPAVLAEYKNGFGVRASSGAIALGGVEAGYYGEAGVRDPHVVTYADGAPYIKDDKVYLTITNAGLEFFATGHWGVWTLDLSTYELEQVGNLFFTREGMDAVLGDHAGHIVRDEANGRWIVAMSTWGDFSFEGVEVNYTTLPLTVDVLSGVHVLNTQKLPLPTASLPTPAAGQWDPHIVKIGSRWYVAFVNASRFFVFYPALARSRNGGDFTDLAFVGADASKVATEGTVMQKIGGEWYVLASNGDDSAPEFRDKYQIYDLGMNFVGNLNAPHPTNIPWPMVFPVPLPDGNTRYVMVTFNGTQYSEPLLGYGTHGDFFVIEAAQRARGYEFRPR